MRNKDKKLQQVKRILSDETLSTPRSGDVAFPYGLRTASTESLLTPSVNTPSSITTRRKVVIVAVFNELFFLILQLFQHSLLFLVTKARLSTYD